MISDGVLPILASAPAKASFVTCTVLAELEMMALT